MQRGQRVAVLGGGVAGMSAAHELAERGFRVEVFERNATYVGGKARSVNVPETNTQFADKYLPGEHGFRFFAGFYKHVTDTMKRTPFRDADGKEQLDGCLGNLVATKTVMMARYNAPALVTISSFPRSLNALEVLVHDLHEGPEIGLTHEEEKFFAERLWQLMTSCIDRRDDEYESLSWWDYVQAERFSKNYQTLLANGLVRTLVAAQAKTASTKTGGNTLLQLIFTMMDPSFYNDRVLNGPTNDQWLTPWIDYLRKIGVDYHLGTEVTGISMESGRVASAEVSNENGEVRTIEADYFVLATPVERAATLVTDDMIAIDDRLGKIAPLAKSVSWMNGIQFYLNEDVEITTGHIIFTDSEWALTGISQIQFWRDYDLSDRFNGTVKGILSVDISDWLHTTFEGHLAEDLPADEVKDLVWKQLKKSLNTQGATVLRDDMVEHWYLDRDIRWNPIEQHERDVEPLLVNTVDSWALRPEAVTRISNFFLASDYVRTNTDLATMEGANEAARRAVNGILAATGSDAPLCEIWKLTEPWFFKPLKWLDQRRFNSGQPWNLDTPWWMKLAMVPWGLAFAGLWMLRSLASLLPWAKQR